MRQSYITCPDCGGRGHDAAPDCAGRLCGTCRGSGHILRPAEPPPPAAGRAPGLRLSDWIAELRAEAGRAYAAGNDDLARRYREAADRLAELIPTTTEPAP